MSDSERSRIEIAPCLHEGPLAAPGSELVEEAAALSPGVWSEILKAWSIPFVFHERERVFAAPEDPVAPIQRMLEALAASLRRGRQANRQGFLGAAEAQGAEAGSVGSGVEDATGEHYGKLFRGFSSGSYSDETPELLRVRLSRNGIDPDVYEAKHLLDAGCGGGRYSLAWRRLGAGSVTGLDISEINIEEARQRAEGAQLDGLAFERGNVLDLPYPDDHFDAVFSNGVLHHTTDWKGGVRELVRVLRPGGWGWLYVISDPGGLFWDTIEILRVVTRGLDRSRARKALRLLGLPGNRVFYMLDHVLVPINLRSTPDEVEATLRASGARDILRLVRGTDFDRIESIHRDDPHAVAKYGVGENRFVFSK